jgi:hypothetical protein
VKETPEQMLNTGPEMEEAVCRKSRVLEDTETDVAIEDEW